MYHILSLLCTYTEQGRSLQRLARMTISLFTRAWRGGDLASIIKKKNFQPLYAHCCHVQYIKRYILCMCVHVYISVY